LTVNSDIVVINGWGAYNIFVVDYPNRLKHFQKSQRVLYISNSTKNKEYTFENIADHLNSEYH
jgi:hypothetical protein